MPKGPARDDFNLQEAFVLARETQRGLLLVNGGGAVALLSFYGNLLSKDELRIFQNSADLLTASLICFAGGLLLAVLSTGFGYLTQLSWSATPSDDRGVKEKEKRATRFFVIALACAVLSPVAFAGGVVTAALGLRGTVSSGLFG